MEFIVLPDNEQGEAVAAARSGEPAREVITHASGRPWIVGTWSAEDLAIASVGRNLVVLLGRTGRGTDALVRALERVRTPADLDGPARSLHGSHYLLASLDGRVRVQGTLSAARQVHFAEVDGVTVAAESPLRLVGRDPARLDEEAVATRLLSDVPWPLNNAPLWRGTRQLPQHSCLEIDLDGRARVRRWWSPPEPEAPLSTGAADIRTALEEAVRARTHDVDALSADLSGGMDSTSVAFLAARESPRLLACREATNDVSNDDGVWADRAAAQLPGVEYDVTPWEEQPHQLAGLLRPDFDPEEPLEFIRTREHKLLQARRAAAWGSTRHLTGHGGDQLFLPSPTGLHTLVRRHPLRALRSIRANSAMLRWGLLPTLRQLADGGSYGKWLAAAGDRLDAPAPGFAVADIGWGAALRMPPWATGDAVDSARDRLRAAAVEAEPLAASRGDHEVLHFVRQCGDTMRQVDRIFRRYGISAEAPFLDDRVVEATLAIRVDHRNVPGSYKPALAAAMRSVVPQELIQRPTKAEYSAEVYAGLRRHQDELMDMCDDLKLARLGLVDADALRAALLRSHPGPRTMVPLMPTLACESWLRSLYAVGATATSGTGDVR
ncbi:asparagine synthase-related protein [Streptomyces sp. XM4193]|uniref:asparagine synthase-related protein n=1 Tax=Streptomyces sp. XM4193 TaxID=2929782 RepID=UPI001FF8FEDB|nr:asparagine synthase-related protein [Streptomyces sp. XM4193]MCK1794767.1 asparagine synthase-related protein [Streptomyces sp. XM4193]